MKSNSTSSNFINKFKMACSAGLNLLILSVLILSSIGLVTGCKTIEQGQGTIAPAAGIIEHQEIQGGAWLSVFLNLSDPLTGQEVSIEISSIEVKTDKGWFPLSSKSLAINAKQLGGGQILVARNMVPAEVYGSMRFSVLHASVKRDGKVVGLPMSGSLIEMEFPAGLKFKKDDSHSVFINWDVLASMDDKGMFAAAFKTTMQSIPVISDLIFLACPEIDTIYVMRTDKNWVISSLGVPGQPTYLEIDEEKNRLYALTPADSTIKIIDYITFRIIDEISINLDFEPTYMFFSPTKLQAYVLDKKGKNIAKIDILSGTQVDRVSLSYRPQYGIYLEERNMIALSDIDANKVYLLNPQNLFNVNSFSVGSNPDGLLYWRNLIFVAESGSNTVAAYDLMDRSQRSRIHVGFSPRRLFLKNNQIYITNFSSSSVTVMFPGQFNVSGEISVKGKPFEMAASQSRRWLYVTDSERGGLSVIDPTSNRINGFIDLATLPLGMAVIN